MAVQFPPYDVAPETWPSVGSVLSNRGPVWLDEHPGGTDVHQHQTHCDDPQRSAVGFEKSHQSAAKRGARRGKQEFPDCASGRDDQSEETKVEPAKMDSANIQPSVTVFPHLSNTGLYLITIMPVDTKSARRYLSTVSLERTSEELGGHTRPALRRHSRGSGQRRCRMSRSWRLVL